MSLSNRLGLLGRKVGMMRLFTEDGDAIPVTVLDVSLDQNRDALQALLQAGAEVAYFDHHHAGELPVHARFSACIDTGAQVCTSILEDRHLKGAHRGWAVAGAFGDNLADAARALGARHSPQKPFPRPYTLSPSEA